MQNRSKLKSKLKLLNESIEIYHSFLSYGFNKIGFMYCLYTEITFEKQFLNVI